MSESADNYHAVVARLNPRWRIIVCAQGVQWILQYRASAETYATSRWAGRSYCRRRTLCAAVRESMPAPGGSRRPGRASGADRGPFAYRSTGGGSGMTDLSTMSGADRLRPFEDRVLPGAPRHLGRVEDGSGSRYSV
jgi:hypothetical protein